ncbi:triple tyrosine motif-containing protein [Marinigracilibium pacificum]|uniref:Two component regulator three y domain-containing protein n=1 Tax=Marinigracilibium pacificum TaxID=2729599 RepID=A0A848IY26_9BACT|nr:triple tyrosine motif-containing protein [Marinigracilibium pacificum]NMM48536.1 two component regulator three y domain-containing protein [Marinigracilibium pacificum]
MGRLLFLFLFISTQTISGQNSKGLPFTKYFSTQDYEGGIQNWTITQNNDGLIYVANNFGLLEYDANSWDRYMIPNGTKMRDVMIGPKGKIYVAVQGDFGYVIPSMPEGENYVSLADSLPDQYRNFDETWKVFNDGQKIYFCTFRQIFIYENDQFIDVIEPQFPPENFHFVNNRLFVNELEYGLTYLDNGELKLFDQGDFFKGIPITSIIPLANNHLLIFTDSHGAYTWNGVKFDVWNNEIKEALSKAVVNTAIRLSSGNMAIGTQNQGLYITDSNGEVQYYLNKGNGLNNRTVLSLFEDIYGNLWVGHNNGISVIEMNIPFTIISEQSNLPGTGYDGLLVDDILYLGTNNGLYFKPFTDKSAQNFSFIPNTTGQVYSIKEIDNLLLLGHHLGAFQIKDQQVNELSDILGTWTYVELPNHPDMVVCGTYKGLLLFRRDGETLKFVRKLKGFDESSRVMEVDSNGDIWMTHGYKGVYRIKLNDALDSVTVDFYGQKNGLPSNNLINVWKINGRLIFSTETTVFSFNEQTDRFEPDKYFSEFFDNNASLSFMEQDPMGNIYFLSTDEIGVLIKQSNGTYEKNTKVFNRLKGLLNDDLQNLSVLSSNQVVYGAKEGFILYSKSGGDPSNLSFNAMIRRIYNTTNPTDSLVFSGYYYDDGELTSDLPAERVSEYDYSQNSFRFEYSAPFYQGANSTQYQYILENHDDEWSAWSESTIKEYTNLKEGTYTFKVRAKNIYDQISEEDTYTFVIISPWYRTPLAYISGAGFLMFLVIGVFYFIDKKHKNEKRLMELNQKKAINQKEFQLRSSVEKIEQLEKEKLQSQVESKNKELATSTMHLLNKNSFINSIKHNISSIIKRSNNQEVKKELNKIMVNIDKNIASDEDWDHFAIHFDQVHGDFTKRLKDSFPKLTPQEMKLSAYLRMNLSTKEIAHLLNISVRGVEIARYRLRKKLDLDRSDNLQEFILKY